MNTSSTAPTARLPRVEDGGRESEPPPLLGLYRRGGELGRGGMGLVHEGRHLFTAARAALKVLPRWAAHDRDFVARFERENGALRALSHPSTVRALTPVNVTRGWRWYAMERIDGESLHELVRDLGGMPVARAAHLFGQITGALAEAHGRGLVHRDLKPANVMIARPRGRGHETAKLLDFGLVRDMEEPPESRISRGDILLGTPGFLAPEGYESPLVLDARSDVFALGLIGHTLLTGARRYGTTPPDDASLRLSGADCHDARHLLAAVRRCLDPDPRRRPRDAREVLEMLDPALAEGWPAPVAKAWWSQRPR